MRSNSSNQFSTKAPPWEIEIGDAKPGAVNFDIHTNSLDPIKEVGGMKIQKEGTVIRSPSPRPPSLPAEKICMQAIEKVEMESKKIR